jgi:hypothetical protein
MVAEAGWLLAEVGELAGGLRVQWAEMSAWAGGLRAERTQRRLRDAP